MGDKDNTLSVCGQIGNDLHQALDLLRSQGCGRLIQNQGLRAAVQYLQDLHTLLHADRDIFYLCVRIYLHAVALRQLQHLFLCGFLVYGQPLDRFHAQNDILGYSKRLDQHEVLVYHTDSDVNGILRAVEMNLFFIDKDLSTGRFVQSAEHIHHGALSGSVLT